MQHIPKLRIFSLIDSPASCFSRVRDIINRVNQARRVFSDRYPSSGFSPQQKTCVWQSINGGLRSSCIWFRFPYCRKRKIGRQAIGVPQRSRLDWARIEREYNAELFRSTRSASLEVTLLSPEGTVGNSPVRQGGEFGAIRQRAAPQGATGRRRSRACRPSGAWRSISR